MKKINLIACLIGSVASVGSIAALASSCGKSKNVKITAINKKPNCIKSIVVNDERSISYGDYCQIKVELNNHFENGKFIRYKIDQDKIYLKQGNKGNILLAGDKHKIFHHNDGKHYHHFEGASSSTEIFYLSGRETMADATLEISAKEMGVKEAKLPTKCIIVDKQKKKKKLFMALKSEINC